MSFPLRYYQMAHGAQRHSSFQPGLSGDKATRAVLFGGRNAASWANAIANYAELHSYSVNYMEWVERQIEAETRPPAAARNPTTQLQQSAGNGRRKRS